MKQHNSITDVVHYICDYLPEAVSFPIYYKRKKISLAFKLVITIEGSKGLSLCYCFEPAYSSYDIKNHRMLSWDDADLPNGENTFTQKINKKFGNNYADFIYLNQYIRSTQELLFTARHCHKFLKKHGLVTGRIRNTKKSAKLFSAASFIENNK